MVRDILKLGHPLLRATAREISKEELRRPEMQALIDDMIETMRSVSGAGLAAPQVGESVRVCVAEVGENPRYPDMDSLPLQVWVNPSIEVLSQDIEVSMYEGCLSVPGIRGRVKRPGNIRLRFWDRHGDVTERTFVGSTASVVQHECDHLDGTLFVDHADPKTLCMLSEYEKYVVEDERLEIIRR